MKAALSTFHRVYNFGAKIQQYALSEAIGRMGCSAYVLDIFDRATQNLYHPQWSDLFQLGSGPKRYAKTIARDAVEIALKPFRRNLFRAFGEEHLREGKLPGEPGAPLYDVLICGSDQVWNPAVTNGDPRYFLRFESPATKVRIAYAPSFGSRDQVPESFLPTLREHLLSIDVLSCRELEGCALVEELTQRSCPRMPDPVMLLTPEDWARLAHPPQNAPQGKFVFCFDMQQTPLLRSAAEALAKDSGAAVFFQEGHLGKKGWRSPVGPLEFLWLIRNAACVVTNSFHGTALSILFGTPLRVVYPSGRVTRIKELLDRFRLAHLLVSSMEDALRPAPWDPAATRSLLDAERALGRDFLARALERAR